MSSEFVRSQSRPALPALQPDAPLHAQLASDMLPLLPLIPTPPSSGGGGMTADVLFDTLTASATLEDVPLFEEVAILFADGQTRMVEQLLNDTIEADNLGPASVTAWAMLLDLHQANGDQGAFEQLSIAYAKQFETSPPAWMTLPEIADAIGLMPDRVTTVVLSGMLDAGVHKLLEPAQAMVGKDGAVRLDFLRITAVDPAGCGLLLHVLRQLEKSGNDLLLVGMPGLVASIRRIIKVGHRDETEVAWMLLLQLLALQNMEPAFEEASIEYCVTFEVSPPAFVAPKTRTGARVCMETLHPASDPAPDLFTMPAVIGGPTDALLTALGAFVASHDPARIDCSSLARIDVNAASQLRAILAPLVKDGRQVEFINVSHLVAALLDTIGLKEIARIRVRRN